LTFSPVRPNIPVEGHGHIHTLRADIGDFPGVVIREDPKVAIAKKLDYLRWLREQIEAGFQEQLPVRVIEASWFPWGSRTSWESCATDECIRLLSLGHVSRTELVRSFVRTDGDQLPTVYEVRYREGSNDPLVQPNGTIGRRSSTFHFQAEGIGLLVPGGRRVGQRHPIGIQNRSQSHPAWQRRRYLAAGRAGDSTVANVHDAMGEAALAECPDTSGK
jgi:hypothetical protein